MNRHARRAVLASLSLLALSLWSETSAQTRAADDAPPARKKPVDVFNRINGESTVLKRKPAGTVVKKGDWVVEFDPTDLQDALTAEKIELKSVEAAYRYAKMTREVVEIGVKEFADGISKEDIELADVAISKAKSERARAEDRAKGSESEEDKVALVEARINEQKAKDKKAILIKYTEVKNIKELESEVFKAKEAELDKEAAWQGEKLKAEKLRKEIEACKVLAPIDGTIGYLRPVDVEDSFRQGEVVFRIFPGRTPRADSPPK